MIILEYGGKFRKQGYVFQVSKGPKLACDCVAILFVTGELLAKVQVTRSCSLHWRDSAGRAIGSGSETRNGWIILYMVSFSLFQGSSKTWMLFSSVCPLKLSCFASFSFLHNQVVFVCLFVSYFLLIMFWCSVSHVQVVGRPLSSPFDIEINNSSGKCTLKYNPETQSSEGEAEGEGDTPSRLRTFTTRLLQLLGNGPVVGNNELDEEHPPYV